MPDAGRVVAGTARGTRLEAPAGGTRPLGDRVKESLFAALEAAGVLNGTFLDLFAGSGAAGIEALSRGATSATFIERDGKACAVIGDNLRRTHLAQRAHVIRADVVSHLQGGSATTRIPFRACLVDPPYGEPVLLRSIELLGEAERNWLESGAIVVAKHFWRDELPERVGCLAQIRRRRFGETALTFYTRAEEER
jgi:16S rRNA (guanine966-N2)-methyltransferase